MTVAPLDTTADPTTARPAIVAADTARDRSLSTVRGRNLNTTRYRSLLKPFKALFPINTTSNTLLVL